MLMLGTFDGNTFDSRFQWIRELDAMCCTYPLDYWAIFFRCIAQCASCPSRASTLSDTCSFLVRLFFVFALWLAAHKLWFHQMSSMVGPGICNCISFLFCRIWIFCVRRVTSPPYGWVGGNSGGRVRITFEITNFTNNPISVISYYHLYCQITNFTNSTNIVCDIFNISHLSICDFRIQKHFFPAMMSKVWP